MPILQVDHNYDPEEGVDWQFHCGNDDYAMEKMRLVRLSTILQIDPDIINVSDLPSGYVAVRKSSADKWEYLENE